MSTNNLAGNSLDSRTDGSAKPSEQSESIKLAASQAWAHGNLDLLSVGKTPADAGQKLEDKGILPTTEIVNNFGKTELDSAIKSLPTSERGTFTDLQKDINTKESRGQLASHDADIAYGAAAAALTDSHHTKLPESVRTEVAKNILARTADPANPNNVLASMELLQPEKELTGMSNAQYDKQIAQRGAEVHAILSSPEKLHQINWKDFRGAASAYFHDEDATGAVEHKKIAQLEEKDYAALIAPKSAPPVETAPKPEPKPVPKPEPTPEPAPKTTPPVETTPAPKPEPTPEPAPKTTPPVETTPAPKPEPTPEPAPKTTPPVETTPAPKPEPTPEPAPKTTPPVETAPVAPPPPTTPVSTTNANLDGSLGFVNKTDTLADAATSYSPVTGVEYNGTTYKLAFNSEFSGNTLNTKQFPNLNLGGLYSEKANGDQGTAGLLKDGSDPNIVVANGAANLYTFKQQNTIPSGSNKGDVNAYTTGALQSAFAAGPGSIFQFTAAEYGNHDCAWVTPPASQNFYSGEIDIAESKGGAPAGKAGNLSLDVHVDPTSTQSGIHSSPAEGIALDPGNMNTYDAVFNKNGSVSFFATPQGSTKQISLGTESAVEFKTAELKNGLQSTLMAPIVSVEVDESAPQTGLSMSVSSIRVYTAPGTQTIG